MFLEIFNFILNDYEDINVIVVRTNTSISDIIFEDINHVLEDRQTSFWLNNLHNLMWNNPRMNPEILLLLKEAEMIELEIICVTVLVMAGMEEVVRFISRAKSQKWERADLEDLQSPAVNQSRQGDVLY